MISHLHKTIFIHIPKCAGRSIAHALNEAFDHYTAAYYQTQHPDFWEHYTVFTTVRNPYQRLLSMYYYIKKEPVHAHQAITNFGNMPPFKNWVMTNIARFKGEFEYTSAEGNREQDGDTGSTFWFSSQVSRLYSSSQAIYGNIHILRYEDGMQAVEEFLQRQAGVQLSIPHINYSQSNSINNYLQYYDQELLDAVNAFPPFVKDCSLLQYNRIKSAQVIMENAMTGK